VHEPWAVAWDRALYGPGGFYRRSGAPGRHFRTAPVAAGDLLGAALAGLAREAGCGAVVDVGAGGGELLAGVRAADPGLRLTGVDVAPRPAGLDQAIAWGAEPVARAGPVLLVGWELLDAQPCEVLEADADGALHQVLVDPTGQERPGPAATAGQLRWADRWWPGPWSPGDRVEVGTRRDDLWRHLVDRVVGTEGLALAVDYDHCLGDRPAQGSLAGFRSGRRTSPVPDGDHDVTAHVALDAVASHLPGSVRVEQAGALRRLGVTAPRPDPALAGTEPAAYLAALQRASRAGELLDRGALGGFGWLLTPRGATAAGAVARLLAPS
jgi:SAM-dependent MidA family methyltransferase